MYDNVAEPFMKAVERCPERTALVTANEQLTYAQLNRRIDACAHVLTDHFGIKPGDRVAYLLPNSCAIVEVFYAIQKIGAVAVPINCRHIASEIAYLVKAADACLLVYCDRFADRARAASAALGDAVRLCMVADEGAQGGADSAGAAAGDAGHEELGSLMACAPEAPVALHRDPASLARIQFTGGSTGLPKGAARTHHADLVEIEGVMASNGMDKGFGRAVVLIQCPLEHHGGHSWLTSSLAAGATLVVCGRFDEREVLSRIERHRVTHMILLPPVTYLRLTACPDIDSYDLSSVELVQSAAGANNRKVIEEVFAHFPNAELNYGWGQSEGGLGTTQRVTRAMLEADVLNLLSIGKPMKGAALKLVDEDGNEVTEPLSHGEALIKSEAIMEGYYRQPELTEKVMFGDGWLRTGDLMLRDAEGNYYLCARTKDVIKSGGENVFAGEVEHALAAHPDVLDCMVFGTLDETMGEAVAAVVSLRPGATVSGRELQEHCKRTLSSYKKPRYILFVDDLGKDDAGKVRKRAVMERFEREKASAALF